jgi:hypothetical protein
VEKRERNGHEGGKRWNLLELSWACKLVEREVMDVRPRGFEKE